MKERTKQNCYKYSTYLGCVFLLVPNGVTHYWGNLSAYTNSYLRATLGPVSGIGSPLVISLCIMGVSTGVMLSNVIGRYAGYRLTVLAAILFMDASIFSCYYFVQKSAIALIVAIGGVAGISNGMLYGHVLHSTIAWKSKYIGIITSVTTCGLSIGSLPLNQIITLYINPHNAPADLVVGRVAYFTQTEILERVPNTFLILGGIAFSCHMISFILMRDTEREGEQSKDEETAMVSEEKHTEKRQPLTNSLNPGETLDITKCNSLKSTTTSSTYASTDIASHTSLRKDTLVMNGLSNNQQTEAASGMEHNGGPDQNKTETGIYIEDICNEKRKKTVQRDFTTCEILKTKSFYAMWICNLASDFSFIIVSNYYKTFGLLWIPDDHFLSTIFMVVVIAGIFSKMGWGYMADRFGIKYTVICFLSCNSLLSFFWYLIPRLGKWMYMVWTTMLGCTSIGLYLVFSLCTLKLFGPAHFTMNFGAVISSGIVINFAGPPFMDAVLRDYGWFALFLTSGTLNASSLVIAVITLPRM